MDEEQASEESEDWTSKVQRAERITGSGHPIASFGLRRGKGCSRVARQRLCREVAEDASSSAWVARWRQALVSRMYAAEGDGRGPVPGGGGRSAARRRRGAPGSKGRGLGGGGGERRGADEALLPAREGACAGALCLNREEGGLPPGRA